MSCGSRERNVATRPRVGLANLALVDGVPPAGARREARGLAAPRLLRALKNHHITSIYTIRLNIFAILMFQQ